MTPAGRSESRSNGSTSAPLPLPDGTRALRFPNQGRFHPLKYVRGLIGAIEAPRRPHPRRHRLRRSCRGRRWGHHRDRAPARDPRRARRCSRPIRRSTTRSTIHTKQVPIRTYVIAGPVPKGSVPDLLIWDTLDAYHYVRLQPLGRRRGSADRRRRGPPQRRRPTTWTSASPISKPGPASASRRSARRATAGRAR